MAHRLSNESQTTLEVSSSSKEEKIANEIQKNAVFGNIDVHVNVEINPNRIEAFNPEVHEGILLRGDGKSDPRMIVIHEITCFAKQMEQKAFENELSATRRLMESNLPFLQPVLNTRAKGERPLWYVTQKEDMTSVSAMNISTFEQAIALAEGIERAYTDIHAVGIYHGDPQMRNCGVPHDSRRGIIIHDFENAEVSDLAEPIDVDSHESEMRSALGYLLGHLDEQAEKNKKHWFNDQSKQEQFYEGIRVLLKDSVKEYKGNYGIPENE